MANFISAAKTGYFTVADEQKYAALFAKLEGDDEVCDFTRTNEFGQLEHAFGCYGDIWFENEDEDCDEDGYFEYTIEPFFHALSEIISPDSACIFIQCGWEKLRFVEAYSCIVTRGNVDYLPLNNKSVEIATERLNAIQE